MPNTQNLKPFEKEDSRINRRGRPRKADLFAQYSRSMLEELVPYGPDNRYMTRLEAILREWLDSGVFRKQLAVIQYAYGKVPNNPPFDGRDAQIVVDWNGKITSHIEYLDEDDESRFIKYSGNYPKRPAIDIP